MYYGKIPVLFTKSTGENPGVAAAVAIVVSVLVGLVMHVISRNRNYA